LGGIFAGTGLTTVGYADIASVGIRNAVYFSSPKNELIRAPMRSKAKKTFESHRARSVPESSGGDKDSGD
jgi:hypothetical protein